MLRSTEKRKRATARDRDRASARPGGAETPG